MTDTTPPKTFQDLIRRLTDYWVGKGCAVMQPYDLPMGAATFHPASFLRAIGPAPWRSVYVQGCRRPGDGRYGENPYRLQHYYQMQVVLKPSPDDIQDLYLDSLKQLGVNPLEHDVRFVEDNWESPTLGAWGLGWEVRLDGMEISQFTYFQQAGGLECRPVTGEIAYGLERLAMHLQDKDDTFDLAWSESNEGVLTYGDVFRQNEAEGSAFNFEHADVEMLTRHFDDHERECRGVIEKRLPLPAYEQVILASHAFNLLDARHAISVSERQRYVLRIRKLATEVAALYLETRGASDHHPRGDASNRRPRADAPARHSRAGTPARHFRKGAPARHFRKGAPARHFRKGAPARHSRAGASGALPRLRHSREGAKEEEWPAR